MQPTDRVPVVHSPQSWTDRRLNTPARLGDKDVRPLPERFNTVCDAQGHDASTNANSRSEGTALVTVLVQVPDYGEHQAGHDEHVGASSWSRRTRAHHVVHLRRTSLTSGVAASGG